MYLADVARNKLERFIEVTQRLKRREGVYRILDGLRYVEDGGLLIARVPTGYGKSILSLFIASAVKEFGHERGILRVIHVLPMRTLLQDLYERVRTYILSLHRKDHCDDVDPQDESQHGYLHQELLKPLTLGDVAYQASIFIDEGTKSQLFLKPYILTTFDSYVLNFSKLTPLRSKRVSYHAARSAIFTSLTIFDEAHLFAEVDEAKAYTSMISIIKSLLSMNIPVAIFTATVPDSLISRIVSDTSPEKCVSVTMLQDGDASSGSVGEGRCRNIVFYDKDWREPNLLTDFVKPSDIAEIVKRSVDGGKNILIVRNNVFNAIKTYEQVLNIVKDKDRVFLLHGRLRHGEQKEAMKKLLCNLRKSSGVVAISTQVVEAGVDVDVDVLITDPAPMAQLVQRVGRVCRDVSRPCKGEVYIVDDEENVLKDLVKGVYDLDLTKQTIEKLKSAIKQYKNVILWRTPSITKGNSYFSLLNEIYNNYYNRIRIDEEVKESLEMIDKIASVHRNQVEIIELNLCGFVRDTIEVPLIYDADGVVNNFNKCVERETWVKCYNDHVVPNIVRVNHKYLCNNIEELLLESPENTEVYVLISVKEEGGEVRIMKERIDLSSIVELVRKVRERSGRDGSEALWNRLCREFMNIDKKVFYSIRKKLEELEDDVERFAGFIGFALRREAYIPNRGLVTDVKHE